MLRIRCFLIFFISTLFVACDTERVFEKNENIPNKSWDLNHQPEFNVTITDTSALYKVYVNVRHSVFYVNSNLWLNITTTFPDGNKIEKRVELTLADSKGKWYGSCLGDICDIRVQIQEKAYFEKPGEYIFKFEQLMRTEKLNDVLSVGLRLEKAGLKGEISR